MTTIVYGCGAWGTVLSALVAAKNQQTYIVCHDEKIKNEINTQHTNLTYLPAQPTLPANLKAIMLSEAGAYLPQSEFVFVVVASSFYRQTLKSLASTINKEQIIISATKGMEENTNLSVLEIAAQELPKVVYKKQFTLLSGPNLAEEIFLQQPAATVVASQNLQAAKKVQELISSALFRAYISDDIIGVEYGGILKNVIAIAAGILDALNLGANAKSALLVRGIAEMKRFTLHYGGKEETIAGLSGFGDLITTCLGPKSRNYSVGYRIGKGEKSSDIEKSMVAVAEGVKTCKVVYHLAQKEKIEMPIIEAIYNVIYCELPVSKAIEILMTRELKKED